MNHLFQLLQAVRPHLNHLVRLRLRFPRRQPFRQQDKHALFHKSRGREHVQKHGIPLRPVARLFQQFPHRRPLRRLSRIHPSRHQFPQILPRRMPVLPDQHYRPRMRDHLPRSSHPSRFQHLIPPHSKHRPLIHHHTLQYLCFSLSHFSPLRSFVFSTSFISFTSSTSFTSSATASYPIRRARLRLPLLCALRVLCGEIFFFASARSILLSIHAHQHHHR